MDDAERIEAEDGALGRANLEARDMVTVVRGCGFERLYDNELGPRTVG
jgi:hypothetical protein